MKPITKNCMIVSAWNNGDHSITGAGYGLKIPKKDKIKYFKQSWEKVIIILDSQEVHVNLADSFWRNCRELRSKKIGQWLIEKGHNKWGKGKPPKFTLEHVNKNILKLSI
jgi:hypothetical protein